MAQPTLPPLSSFSEEYIHSYTGDTLRDVDIAFCVIETVFITLRYLSRWVGKTPWGIDDYLMLPAFIFCMGLNTLSFLAIKYGGVGYHMIILEITNPKVLVPWAKVLVASPILYSVAVCLPKLAILVIYLRVFIEKWQRVATYVLMGLVISVAVADVVAGGLQCVPLQYLWDKSIPGGSCYNIPAFYRYDTLPNSITDFLMLLLPLPLVWQLKTSLRVKIGLMFTFAAGSIGLIASILRTVSFFQHNPLVDGTRASVIFLYWTVVEPGCYLIAACLVCFRPLLNLVLGKADDSRARSVRTMRKRFSHRRGRSSLSSNSHSNSNGEVNVSWQLQQTSTSGKMVRDTKASEDEETLVGL